MGEGEEVIDLGGRKVPIRQYASWFNFKGGDQQKTVGNLSGAFAMSLVEGLFAAFLGFNTSLAAPPRMGT